MRYALARLLAALQHDGLLAGLEVLNSTVPHRFTSISLLDGADLANAGTVDKLGEPLPAYFAFTPVDLSFCQFALRAGHFGTDNSRLDARLDGLPYQGVIVAYHAVRIESGIAGKRGTLNHYDFCEREFTTAQSEFLAAAAKLVTPFVPWVAKAPELHAK